MSTLLLIDMSINKNNFQIIKDTSALFTINKEGYFALKDHIELTLEGNIFVFCKLNHRTLATRGV